MLNTPDVEAIMIRKTFEAAVPLIGLEFLAVALGFGCVKYERNNWKKGFGGDYKRFLRASLRHTHLWLTGSHYDGTTLPGYARGNCHRGAILFSLMVAMHEAETLEEF
jgi:hypothetical protein